MLHLKTGLPHSQLYLLIDGSVILTAGLVFGWEEALYAFITLFLSGLVADYVLEGPSVVRSAFIVTDTPEEVSEALIHRLEAGVTGGSGEGMLSHVGHTILFCTVHRPDVSELKAVVSAADPKAFVVIVQGQQTRGGTLPQALRRLAPK